MFFDFQDPDSSPGPGRAHPGSGTWGAVRPYLALVAGRLRAYEWGQCGGPDARWAGRGAKPILELNMSHALVKALGLAQTRARADDVADLAALLLDQAQILDGELPNDPTAFAALLNRLLVRGL